MCDKCVKFREALGVKEDSKFKDEARQLIKDQIDSQETFPKRVNYKDIHKVIQDMDDQLEFLVDVEEIISHRSTPEEITQMADIIIDKLVGYALPCCKEAMNFFYYHTIPSKQRHIKTGAMEGALRMNKIIELTAESLTDGTGNNLIRPALVAMTTKALTDDIADFSGRVICVNSALRKVAHPLADLPIIMGDTIRGTDNHKKLEQWRKIQPENLEDETAKFEFLYKILKDIPPIPNDVVMYHQMSFTQLALDDKAMDNREITLADFLPISSPLKLRKLVSNYNLDYDKARYWVHWVHLSAFMAIKDVSSEQNKIEMFNELWTVARCCVEEEDFDYSQDILTVIENGFFGGSILPYDKNFQEYLTFNEFCREKLKTV